MAKLFAGKDNVMMKMKMKVLNDNEEQWQEKIDHRTVNSHCMRSKSCEAWMSMSPTMQKT